MSGKQISDTGLFQTSIQIDHVVSILKKCSHSKDDRKSYRAVPNVSLVSKIIETVVSSRILSRARLPIRLFPISLLTKNIIQLKRHSFETITVCTDGS